jgi:blue copper oxidase
MTPKDIGFGTLDGFTNPLKLPGDGGLLGLLDASEAPIEMSAGRERVELAPGRATEVLAYRAERGSREYLNPTIRIEKGAMLAVDLRNGLEEDTTVHWHGLRVPWEMDGHPARPVRAGAGYRYEFRVRERGGTYWYHPHGMGNTASQAYLGLAGLLLVEDDEERALAEVLDLRLGETDVPLLLQDKSSDLTADSSTSPPRAGSSWATTGTRCW